MLFFEFFGFIRIDGGVDVGGLGRGLFLMGIFLFFMMRELVVEWILVSLFLLTYVRVGFLVGVGLGFIFVIIVEGEEGIFCGW